MNKKIIFICCYLLFYLFSCTNPDPNLNKKGEDELKVLEVATNINKEEIEFQEVFYVPIYSDIYADHQNQKILLAATLSIRNTSYDDSLFISKIDYFNTQGDLVRSYIDNPIGLSPMATINYVIEKDDDTGGSGANFIVGISSKGKNVSPLIQAIMVGHTGNKGFTFATDGYPIKKKR